MPRPTTIICALACAFAIACMPAVRRSGGPPSTAQLDEFWIDPGPTPRDLFAGTPPANGHVRPATDARFTVVKRDTGGFSITYSDDVAARYVARIRQKITEGLEV